MSCVVYVLFADYTQCQRSIVGLVLNFLAERSADL